MSAITYKTKTYQLTAVTPYIMLVVAVLAAWFPVLGKNLPLIADEYPFTLTLNNGVYSFFTSWLASQGVWRLLGQLINGLLVHHPVFTTYLAVFTHILTVCLFFRVTELLLRSSGLSLVLALVMGIFPWGYETMIHVMGYTPLVSALVFWGNLLLILSFYNSHKKVQFYIFILSFLLTFITQFIYENLVFSFMFSGLIILINEDKGKIKWKSIPQNFRNNFIGLAPTLGSLAYLVLYKITVDTTKDIAGRVPSLNPESILSVYYYQYTNYYIFEPWFNSDTRSLIFSSWDFSKILLFILLLGTFIISLSIFLKREFKLEQQKFPLNNGLLIYIMLLLLGGSLIYVLAGGLSIDTRKKYALIPIILLLFGWILRTLFEDRFKISRKIIAILMTLGLFGISTTWLGIEVYDYEVKRQDAFAEFIVANNITGDIQIEIERGWPNIDNTLGFAMYDDWVINLAIKAKRDRLCCKILVDKEWIKQDPYSVHITQNPNAVKIYFDPNQSRWKIL
ncbi:MAG: hypothetical protein HXY43_17790 [Fischerella sp.]|jgi:hypothetical protein|uniref:hypothetical protein n=1 Tax=Fischerella sp. TaxID=1191 RepID=UPI001845E933|nr:hypothetical protein [Fischerella sp.]NWF61057.1 hypothetical protein [Fischerella sp.]